MHNLGNSPMIVRSNGPILERSLADMFASFDPTNLVPRFRDILPSSVYRTSAVCTFNVLSDCGEKTGKKIKEAVWYSIILLLTMIK